MAPSKAPKKKRPAQVDPALAAEEAETAAEERRARLSAELAQQELLVSHMRQNQAARQQLTADVHELMTLVKSAEASTNAAAAAAAESSSSSPAKAQDDDNNEPLVEREYDSDFEADEDDGDADDVCVSADKVLALDNVLSNMMSMMDEIQQSLLVLEKEGAEEEGRDQEQPKPETESNDNSQQTLHVDPEVGAAAAAAGAAQNEDNQAIDALFGEQQNDTDSPVRHLGFGISSVTIRSKEEAEEERKQRREDELQREEEEERRAAMMRQNEVVEEDECCVAVQCSEEAN